MHNTEPDNMYHFDQDFYTSTIEQITSDAESSKFTSMGIKLTWLENTRPIEYSESQKLHKWLEHA